LELARAQGGREEISEIADAALIEARNAIQVAPPSTDKQAVADVSLV